ncbi:MAG: DUF3617 domain-containing protein [Gammaproteobacteria bacterium]|nr:DUF3617 domain-containing protein [Gammaproteobacteria bacterium]MBT8052049.1 DUF3617 domain-containing protein [Gammaproteobacteria bacterium]MBT8056943.1 DUF3617 domain-containing protein [Gammaproteobacteria bacterium]NNJ78461.1 DUF3617 family protein [Xanthomonadales bacterium]
MNKKTAILVATLAATSPVLAEGIPVEPGLWSVTTTVNMPMLPSPQTTTLEECFTEDMIDMDDMATENMDPNCTFNQAQVDGSMMEWTIDCPVEGGTMHAKWSATSSGDSVEGTGDMTMNMAGQTMNMTMTWTGERIGKCP